MELQVYNWEYFERGKTRYIVFVLFILAVIVVSILANNLVWWVLVFLVAWGYIYFVTKSNEEIKMIIWKKALQIWDATFPWDSLNWFVLEYHTKKERIHNIVILDKKNNPKIYTIKNPNDEENLQKFVDELIEHIPMLEKFDQSTFDRFLRKIKL